MWSGLYPARLAVTEDDGATWSGLKKAGDWGGIVVMGCHMANPSEMFRAMADGDPYPIKAFFTLGNNTLLSYPNQHQILQGMLNQELIVAHEIFMTPTAMLADYVLPGDVFTERNHIADSWSWTNRLTLSNKIVDAPEEASSTFRFWTDLAHRMGFGEHFPWETLEDVPDHRLSRSGRTFAEFADATYMEAPTPEFRKYRKLINPITAPAATERMLGMVEKYVTWFIDEIIETGEADIATTIGVPAIVPPADDPAGTHRFLRHRLPELALRSEHPRPSDLRWGGEVGRHAVGCSERQTQSFPSSEGSDISQSRQGRFLR